MSYIHKGTIFVYLLHMTTYVALLRGINVGGHTKVDMKTLKVLFEELGYHDVRTYINSGNVIFRTAQADPRTLEDAIEKAIHRIFSHEIYVVVRSLDEMDRLMDHLPKSWEDASDKKCNVIFLRHTIDSPDIMQNFAPKDGVEEVYYYPGMLLWSALTSNLTKSTMLKLAGTPLYKQMTIRILNSTKKIHAIMHEVDAA
jgi:uncharacterized protein (DUF1697 family)